MAMPSTTEAPRGTPEATPSVLERKLRKIIDSGVENDPKISAALSELSVFFKDNSLKTRRNLRGEIERRSLGVNSEFVTAFEGVKDLADALADDIATVDSEISAMEAEILQTEMKTRNLTNKIMDYRQASSVLEKKSRILNQFKENFELSDTHKAILTDESSEVNGEFFEGLEQLRKIRRDCEETLLSSGGETSLEIMDKMSSTQEAALQKLYKWTTNSLRSKNASDHILEDKGTPHLSTAMKYLQERPVLFKYVLTEYASFRKSVLVQSFIDALTVGGPGGTPRPIELHAHDPLRYVGDMLAWLHQAAPTESENVRGLLQACDQMDIEASCQEALSTATEGICRPLKTRTEQVVLSESDPVVLFRLANLIRFYSGTFSPVMRTTESSLMSTLKELDVLCFNQFMSVLNARVAFMTTSGQVDSSPQNLSPSPGSHALMSLLKDILSSSTVMEDQEKQFATIVDAIVDPLLRSLNASVAGYSRTDQDVYMLNCLYLLSSTLSLFQFNDAKLVALESETSMRLDTLASEQASHLIAYLGLQPICTLLLKWSKKGAEGGQLLCQVEGMEPQNLARFGEKLDEFLVNPEAFLLPQIALLNSSAQRKSINQRPLSVVLASYKQLYEAIADPKSGYKCPSGVLSKNPDQVSILLQM